jgi:hypothetical protein
MRGLILLPFLAAAAAPALAAPARPATTVTELEVLPAAKCLPARRVAGSPAPRIVSAFPADGAVIRPGRLVVRVTFDRPMTCSGFFLRAPQSPGACPPLRQNMVLSLDRRTFRLICATVPGTAYRIDVGDEGEEAFVSLDGRAAQPYALTFSTSSGPEVTTTSDALAQDR